MIKSDTKTVSVSIGQGNLGQGGHVDQKCRTKVIEKNNNNRENDKRKEKEENYFVIYLILSMNIYI